MQCKYCNKRMRPNEMRGYGCKKCGYWIANCRERRDYDLPTQEIIKQTTTKTDIIFISIAIIMTILTILFIINQIK